jgi:lipoate-protein ligase A
VTPAIGQTLPPLFAELDLWIDDVPRSGDVQMAIDEILLLSDLNRPLLRHYRWSGSWASLGFSQSLAAARSEAPGFRLVRRWTGGGIVCHNADWTFSLLVPAWEKFCRIRPREAYQAIHTRVVAAMSHDGKGQGIRLAGTEDCEQALSCFAGPTLFDVMDDTIGKVCGGAQRRTRQGVLHQGSIQRSGIQITASFGEKLGAEFADQLHEFSPPHFLGERSEHLAETQYGIPAWIERIP